MQPMPSPQPQPHMHMPVVTYDITDLQRKVDKAKALLILDRPFFGMAVSKRTIIYTDKVPTAAMSATGQMYLNPVWCDALTVRQLMFLLAHEALHFMLCHSLRMGTRDHSAWNVACDKVINDTLVHDKVGDPILDGIFMDGARDFSAEQLYDTADVDGPGPGGIGNDIGGPVGDDGLPLDDADVRDIQTQAKLETIQAAKIAKDAGKLPGSIQRIVDELVNVSTPWHDVLEPFMIARVKDDPSWTRPNRRFISQGVYLPGRVALPSMGVLAIIIDASGSVTDKEFDQYNAHINRILHSCNPELVHVIYCDTHVRGHDQFTADDLPITIKADAGGGTKFKPAFDYITDQDLDPDVVIYLTDGDASTNFPQPSYDVVWLTTGLTNFAWGTVIEFKE